MFIPESGGGIKTTWRRRRLLSVESVRSLCPLEVPLVNIWHALKPLCNAMVALGLPRSVGVQESVHVVAVLHYCVLHTSDVQPAHEHAKKLCGDTSE